MRCKLFKNIPINFNSLCYNKVNNLLILMEEFYMLSSARLRFVNKVYFLNKQFFDHYHHDAADLFTSPGRVELIGNHTDHNHGKVIVGTVDLSILALTNKIDYQKFIYKSKGFDEMIIDLEDLDVHKEEFGKSIALIRGVLFYLKEAGYQIGGVEVMTSTNIFKGAGVSSSAAFEMLIGKIMSYYYNDDKISNLELVKIAQKAETIYFNKPCGLLDQIGVSSGGINYIDFIDEENPIIENIDYNFNQYDLILTYCLDSHSKLVSNYSQIKDDMRLVSNFFDKGYLREVSYQDFISKKDEIIHKLGERRYYRAEHFFEENERVEKAYQFLKEKNESEFVKLINQSGYSSFYKLKNCYHISIKENLPQGLILSKNIINDGATRVHGGGFAGTMIALVKKDESMSYLKIMKEKFGEKNVTKLRISKFGTRHVSTLSDILNERGQYYDSSRFN